jgi:hypothetical protein
VNDKVLTNAEKKHLYKIYERQTGSNPVFHCLDSGNSTDIGLTALWQLQERMFLKKYPGGLKLH